MNSRSKRRLTCRQDRCAEPAVRIGYCEEHYQERQDEEVRVRDAQTALWEVQVDGIRFQDTELLAELLRLRSWWDEACRAVQQGGTAKMPKDEAEYALSWCTSLAKELVNAERLRRSGDLSVPIELHGAREWVWDRFRNIEQGLRSNGTRRPPG